MTDSAAPTAINGGIHEKETTNEQEEDEPLQRLTRLEDAVDAA